jgi:ornithine cyclodeaminase/alanine dehydrogenase
MNKIRVISKKDIEAHLNMLDAVRAVEETYILNSEKEIVLFDTVFHDFEEGKADMDIKSGTIDKAGIFGFKLMSWFGDNAKKGLETLVGNIMLYDRETGSPIALLDGASITGMRTGAAGGIGTRYLARQDSEEILMVGAGNQAPFQLAAHLMLMDGIKRVNVYDGMSYEGAVRFCKTIKERLFNDFLSGFSDNPVFHNELIKKYDIVFNPVNDIEKATKTADIIITATPSRKPIIMKEWLSPGTHLTCMGADMVGKQEVDENIFAVARVFADDIVKTSKTGEMEIPIKMGVFSKDDIICEIGKVIKGENPGRLSEDEITLFDASGLAAQDLITAKELLAKANQHNFGVVVEL